ncbi:MAG: AEC family transporter [Lachnospiraceae bacterium]|nr:AEC family transporter [Lachnospiraceae bacterium]
MQEILGRAGCFIAIIVMGYLLRKKNFFKEGDFTVLSKIVLKITLPAAIISSFSGKEIDLALLSLALISLLAGVIYIIIMYVLNIKKGKDAQAFEMLNTAGYNIGNFTMPFVQSFLGPIGVITTSLFDVGNACVCLGGAYSVASVVKGGGSFSPLKIIKALSKSVAFDSYVLMVLLTIFHLKLPAVVVSFADIIANANAFMAMLMIGVGFKLSGERSQIGSIVRILSVRYGVAVFVALGCYFLLPFSIEVRQALVILAFSPIASAAPAFTGDLKGDVGLSSAVNSISIVCSIVFIVALLLIIL